MSGSVRLLGITGGVGSGKSTLMRLLGRAGVPGIDSDAIVHRLLGRGTQVYAEVVAQFGEDILGESGRIDRRRLGRKVFASKASRRRLERIIHPAVFAEIAREVRRLGAGGCKLAAVEIPLLFETGAERGMDKTVVAYAPKSVQLERVMRRDNLSRADTLRRIESQIPIGEKRRRADAIFDMRKPLRVLGAEVRDFVKRERMT